MQVELTITEIAARLGVSERTALRRIADGTLTAEKRGANRYLIDLDDIAVLAPKAWLQSHDERIRELERQVADMKERQEQRLQSLEYRVANLERRLDVLEIRDSQVLIEAPKEKSLPRHEKAARTASQSEIRAGPTTQPSGTIDLQELCLRVKRSDGTIKGHLLKWDKTPEEHPQFEHERVPIENRPGQYHRYFTEEQATRIAEWIEKNTKK